MFDGFADARHVNARTRGCAELPSASSRCCFAGDCKHAWRALLSTVQMGKKKGKGGGAAAAAEPEAAEELAIDGEDEVVIGGYTEEAAAGAAPEEALPTFGEPEPAAEPLPTFGESEPLPTFGEPEPMGMNGMGGGLGAEFAAAPEPDCEAVVQWRAATDVRGSRRRWIGGVGGGGEEGPGAERPRAILRRARREGGGARRRQPGGEKQYVAERDATVQEDSWESVAKMVNLKEVAGADTTRMRNVLIGLKHK